MSEIEWGPWIQHDGAEPVWDKFATRMQRRFESSPELIESPSGGVIDQYWPGFYWRWKRVSTGWFKSEQHRVCDDPAYAPTVAYRFGRDRSAAVEMLREIAADPARKIKAPKRERVEG